ncbi:MAG TPA: protein kinase, partial [Allocoleopsis sp.]
ENTQILQDYQKWIESYSSLGKILRSSDKRQRIFFRRAINVKAIGINSTHKQCEVLAKKLCDNLNDWLKSPHFIDIRDQWLRLTNNDDEIRVLIRTKNQELWKLPWHKLKFLQGHHNIEIALAPQTFLPHIPPTLAPYKRKPEVRILAILGDSTGIDVDKDRQELEKLKQSSQAEITFLVEPKINELGQQLWEQPWDILFFSGHSNTEENLGKIYINKQETLEINYLRESLKKAVENGLKIAIFNSCEGLGLAELHDLLIPQLLVMREPIPDPVAQTFLKHFLSSFSQETSSFYFAVGESRRKLQIEEQKFPCATWLPIICQHPAVIPPTWKDLKNQGIITTLLLNGRFELIKPLNLSEGAFGAIYLAKDKNMPPESNNFCAVKKLKQDWADLATAKRLFSAEAKILEKLAAIPNIPKFIDYFQQDNDYYLVQEYIEGEPLSDFLRHNQFDEEEAIKFLQSMLHTLKAVHNLNLIHRDIKPSNIIKHENKYYLIDFGAAKLDYVQLQNNLTIAIGTPHYAAPEQLKGNPCFASDIYALGMTIIQALTGILPARLNRDNKGNIEQLKSLKLDKSFAECLQKMVREKSSDRYQ